MNRLLSSLGALALLTAASSTALAQGGGMGRFRVPFPGRNPAAATPFELAIARGDQALRRGDYATAQQQFEAAARLNPTDPRPPFYLGEVALRQQQWPAAEARFREAIRRNPRMAEAHADLGTALREQGRAGDATAAYQTAIRLDPSLSEAHFGLAMLLEDAGQRERALAEYRAAVRLAPNDPMPALNLGILLASERPPQGSQPRAEAFRMLQSAVRNAGGERAVLVSAGPALRLLGEHALAADVLERARAQGGAPSASLLGELAQALWAAGNPRLALQRIGEALAVDAQNAELHYVRGLMLAQRGERAEALAEMRAVVRLGAGTPLAQRAQQRASELQRAPAAAPAGRPAPPRR